MPKSVKKSKQKIEKAQRGEKNLFSKSIFQFALPLIPPPKSRNPVAWFQLLNFLHEICYIINQFSTELIYYFWFIQIIQCSEDDGKIETFMTIDRQFQTLEMESTIEGYQNVANLRYMKSNCMFDYLSWLWICLKQPFEGVLKKRCSENIQQIYRRTPIPNCGFNKVSKQHCWNHTSAWVFSCKFVAYFYNTFS